MNGFMRMPLIIIKTHLDIRWIHLVLRTVGDRSGQPLWFDTTAGIQGQIVEPFCCSQRERELLVEGSRRRFWVLRGSWVCLLGNPQTGSPRHNRRYGLPRSWLVKILVLEIRGTKDMHWKMCDVVSESVYLEIEQISDILQMHLTDTALGAGLCEERRVDRSRWVSALR